MNIINGPPVSTNWKGEIYNLILSIVDRLTKMINYELVKVTIDGLDSAEIIIKVVIPHHGLPGSIVTN